MLDKRSWKRLEWTMITKRELVWFDTEDGFTGAVKMQEVSKPFCVGKNQLEICDTGITWVQCAWTGVNLWATAMFDASGKLFQVYFDLADEVHLDGEDSWFTDLILDVVYDPSGLVSVLDADELESAVCQGFVSIDQANRAKRLCERLVSSLQERPESVNAWFEKRYLLSLEKSAKNR